MESPEDIIEPITLGDDPIRPTARGASARSRGSESAALWGTVGLIGLAVGAYVLVRASRPAPEVAATPAPTAAVATSEPEPPRPAPRRPRAERPKAAAPAQATEPAATVHVEPERKVVDPIAGFETNEAFDNPPDAGRPRRRSGQYPGDAARPEPRPNQPDPSFGQPEPRRRP